MKTGDIVLLRNGKKGEVCCHGFKTFIYVDGINIYLKTNHVNTYTLDLNHKTDRSLDVIELNGLTVEKQTLEEKLNTMVELSKYFKI